MESHEKQPRNGGARSRSWRKPATIALVIVVAWTASRFIPIFDWWPHLMAWIDSLGSLGPVAFILLHVVGTILFVPAIVFGMGAAFIYGFWQGFVITLISTTISAMAAFFIARYMARGWVARRIAARPKYAAIDNAVGRQGWKIVLLTRLSPGFPFTLLNYALGVTQVSATAFLTATAVGMAPRTLVHVYAGVFGSSLATFGVDGVGPDAVRILTVTVGIIVTILATVYISRLVQKTVEEEPPEPEEPGQAAKMAVQPAE